MRFGILGPVRAELPDGTPIPLGGPRLRALLAMLLLDAGRPIPADRLIDGLYGDAPPAGAANALQSQVSRLRQSLPVELGPGGYRLATDRDDVDVHRFVALAADGRRALASGDHERAVTVLRQAAGLWRGEPLVDVRDAPFAQAQAARLTELRLTALEDRYAAELGRPAPLPPEAITELRDLIAAHPLRERFRALLMRALVAAGRPAEALTTFEDARRTLADELGADPSPELSALHTAVLRGHAAPGRTTGQGFPGHGVPGRGVSGHGVPHADISGSGDGWDGYRSGPVRHGVPAQLTSFVGRDRELVRVAEMLRSRRLVTLHGPGGAGKTRLAAEAAARHDGDVWFVELAGAGPDGVPSAVQAALGLRDVLVNPPRQSTAAPGVVDRLVAALSDRQLLLVLDNCEHVVDAAAILAARLLAGAPGLRILATSREPLGITGESLLPVAGLPVPPESPAGPPSAATGDRAPWAPATDPIPSAGITSPAASGAATNPAAPGAEPNTAGPGPGPNTAGPGPGPNTAGPGPGPNTAGTGPGPNTAPSAGAELAGFPAVRLFLDRASDVMPGFTVTAGNADAIRRLCRTLDGLPLAVELAAARLHALPVTEIAARLDDRFRLLSGGSRTAAGRHRSLQAVVAWSWDLLTEPERVLARRFTVFTGGAGLDAVERVCGAGPDAVVDVLAGLVAKSLIERDGDRYRMLETIRAFCAERLAESREQERMHRVHAEYFLELAARADPYLRGFDQIAWLDRLDNDRDNLHAAIRRSVAQGAAPTALRLVAALSFYWWLRGLRSEAATLADLTLRGAGPEPPAGHVEEYVLGVFTAALGNGDRTARPAARWADYMRTLTAAPAHPFLLYLSAMAVGPPAGDPAGIMELNRRLRAQIAGDPWSQALGGIGAGWMVMFSGSDPELAGPEFRSSLDGFRALGDRWGTMLALSGLAELAAWRGDPAAAIAPTAEALELARELGSTIDVADLLRGRAQARMDTGDIAGAAADFTRVAELARSAGAPELVAAALLGLGSLALARVAPAPATSSAHTAPLPAASSRGAGSSPPTRAPSSASADAARSSAAGTGSLPPAEAEQGTAFLPPAEAEQGTAFLPPAGAEQGTAARGDAGREALAEALRYCHEALAACPAGWYSADGTRMTILVMLGRIAELSGDRAAAQARYREVFTVRAGMLGFQVMAEALDRLAGLAVTAGDPDRAARLLGAGTALGLRAGPEASEPGRTAASAARAVLGPHRFAEALARGAGLTPDEAVDLSLAPF